MGNTTERKNACEAAGRVEVRVCISYFNHNVCSVKNTYHENNIINGTIMINMY